MSTSLLLSRAVVRLAHNSWREFSWIVAGQVLGAVGAVVGVRLLTSVLPPAEYGEFALALATATLGFQIILGPLVNAYERFYAPSVDAGRQHLFFLIVRRLTARALALVTLLGCLAGALLLIAAGPMWLPLATFALAFALLSGSETVLDAIQNASRQRSVVALHQILRQWLRPLAAVGLITINGTSATGMAGYATASAVVLSSQYWVFRRRMHVEPLRQQIEQNPASLERQIISYAAPFAVWGIFTWLQVSSDRWALQIFGSSTDVGLYSVVSQLGAYPLTLLGATLSQVAAPIVFAHAGEGTDLARLKTAIEICLLVSIVVVCGTAVLALAALLAHAQLFAVLVGPQYQQASFLLPLAVLASGLFVAGQMLSLMPMAMGRSHSLLAPKVWTALLAVALNSAGAYFFGPVGVLVAGNIFAICYLVWVSLVARALFKAQTRLGSRPSLV